MGICHKCGGVSAEQAVFCQHCGVALDASTGFDTRLDEQAGALRDEIEELREVVNTNADVVDEILEIINSSNVYHVEFVPRAISIWGHAVAVGVIVAAVLGILAAIFSGV